MRPQSTRHPSGRAPKRGPSTEYFFIVEELEDRSLLSLTGGLVENALDGLVNPEKEEDPLAATMLLPTTPNENLFENTPSNIPHEIDLPDAPLQTSSPRAADGTALIVYDSHDVPVRIRDLNTVTSTLEVTDSFDIFDLDVQLDITHFRVADLDVFLISPDGTRVELFTDVGLGGDHFTGTILDDEAATSIASASAPFSGRFQSEGLLSAFDGKNLEGTWTLEITDDAAPNSGILNGWSLMVNPFLRSEVEPNNELLAANRIATNRIISAAIDSIGDVDFFRFNVTGLHFPTFVHAVASRGEVI